MPVAQQLLQEIGLPRGLYFVGTTVDDKISEVFREPRHGRLDRFVRRTECLVVAHLRKSLPCLTASVHMSFVEPGRTPADAFSQCHSDPFSVTKSPTK